VRAAGERLDVQRLRVLPVDPVPDTAQPREVAQVLVRGESAGHLVILSIRLSAQHDGGSRRPAGAGPLTRDGATVSPGRCLGRVNEQRQDRDHRHLLRRPVAVIDYTEGLSAPLLGLFGNDDRYPTPELVDQHEAELKRLGKDYEFHRYDGASHGFFYYFAPAYRPEAAMDGWEKVFAFFGTHLS
jgi:pimeloyl-ACP methyl ester carboxylesterase